MKNKEKYPGFVFYPGDYLRDTQCLNEVEQVAYDRIMCEHMRNIVITNDRLKFFTKKLTPDEIAELKSVMIEVEGGFQIEWVAISIIKTKAYSDSRRKNREGKNKESAPPKPETYVPHMDIDTGIGIDTGIRNGNSGDARGAQVLSLPPTKEKIQEWATEAMEDSGFMTQCSGKHGNGPEKAMEAVKEFFKDKLSTGEWADWPDSKSMRRNLLYWMEINGERKRRKTNEKNIRNNGLRPTGIEPSKKRFGKL